jgi:hypothetical protein
MIERQSLSQSDKTTLINTKFEDALVTFIVCLNLSFRTVESYFFIALPTCVSDHIGNIIRIPTSYNTISSWIQ